MQLSHTTVSHLARVVQEEITAWWERPLCQRYAVIQLDAVFVPLKRDRLEKEAVYGALATDEEANSQILGC